MISWFFRGGIAAVAEVLDQLMFVLMTCLDLHGGNSQNFKIL